MSQFVYLYRRPDPLPPSPQQMQERLERWTAWFRSLQEGKHLVERGLPLEYSGGAVVRNKKGNVTDGPYAESKDIVMGFSIVEANDLAEAVALSKGCPALEDAGLVEVRPIMKFP